MRVERTIILTKGSYSRVNGKQITLNLFHVTKLYGADRSKKIGVRLLTRM